MSRIRIWVVNCAMVTLAVAAAGCASNWGWRPLTKPTPVEPDNVVWIWSRGTVNKWRAVVFAPDSVSGIPDTLALKCDSCRLSLPLTQVDSMILGYRYDEGTSGDVAKEVGGAAVAFGGVLLILVLLKHMRS